MPVGFYFNLTYGLRPQVSGIKIATVYRRFLFQVECLIASLSYVLPSPNLSLIFWIDQRTTQVFLFFRIPSMFYTLTCEKKPIS